MSAISASTASKLIADIYDCTFDPGRWPATLSALHEKLGFANASMALNALPSFATVLHATVGVPEAYLGRMVELAPDNIELWGGLEGVSRLPLDKPIVWSRLGLQAIAAENRYYRDWALPQGIDDVIAIGLARDDTMVASIGMGRYHSAGPITDADVANVAIFLPHLQRAVAISRMFELKAVELNAFHGVLDGLATPAFIIDQDLALLHANKAGGRLLQERDPLELDRGRLRAARRGSDETLRAAVSAAVGPLAGGTEGVAGLPLRHRDGRVTALHVLPMPRAGRVGAAENGVVALFVSDPSRPARGVTSVATAAYRLTATEAQIFERIAAGATVEEIAIGLGIAANTVRSHLKQLFGKTGTRRQAELVSLAARLEAP